MCCHVLEFVHCIDVRREPSRVQDEAENNEYNNRNNISDQSLVGKRKWVLTNRPRFRFRTRGLFDAAG